MVYSLKSAGGGRGKLSPISIVMGYSIDAVPARSAVSSRLQQQNFMPWVVSMPGHSARGTGTDDDRVVSLRRSSRAPP
jgi:hypothetical protein